MAVLCCRSLMILCPSGVFLWYVGLIKKQAPVKWISPSNPVAHLRSAWNDNIFAICRSAYPDDDCSLLTTASQNTHVDLVREQQRRAPFSPDPFRRWPLGLRP